MKSTTDSLIAHYDSHYSKPHAFRYRRFIHGPFIRAVLSKAGVRPDMTVLDVGCGQGFFSRLIADYGCHVTGIDLSAVAVKQALALVPEGVFFTSSANEVSLRYDVVFARSFSPYNSAAFASDRTPTEALMRLLKPGGILIWLYNSRLTGGGDKWRQHKLEDARAHFGSAADVFFSLRIESRIFPLSMANARYAAWLARFTGHRIGGELVAIVRKSP